MTDSTARQAALDKLFNLIGDVSSLPTVVVRILSVVNNEDTASDDLLRVISGDPALTVRILRTLNSSAYGMRRQVNGLQAAISLLGFREIRNLALTIHVSRLFRNGDRYRSYRREALWDHLVGVAAATRTIMGKTRHGRPDEAYLAGLLHDLGLILIDQQVHRRFCLVLDELTEGTATCALEQRLIGFDHTELGEFVARRWGMPDAVCAAIRHHHSPETCTGSDAPIVAAVALANHFCSRKGLTSLGVDNVPMPPAEAFTALGLDMDQALAIFEHLDETLEAAAAISIN